MLAARHQSGEVRDVGEQPGPHVVGDGAELGEVDGPRVSRSAADDQPGPVLDCQSPHLVVVDQSVLFPDAVLDHVEPFAGQVRRRAMAQVAARGQGHAEDGVPGPDQA